MSKEKKIIQPVLPKGTRDFLPGTLRKREKVIDKVKSVFEKFGYEPLETPAMETLEVLSGKYGEEGDKLLFKVLKRGEELKEALERKDYGQLADLGLRYDLTVPLCRVIASYQNEIKLPFKRYQIQPVWRADRPQKGRYREFYQCDVDVVGASSLLADAEMVQITFEILKSLGFEDFKIRLNHRKILSGLVEYCGIEKGRAGEIILILDKFDKVGLEGVREELKKRSIPNQVRDRLLPLLELEGKTGEVLAQLEKILSPFPEGKKGVDESREWMSYVKMLEIPEENLRFDLYLARGLEYYTGPIFESVVEKEKIGSLTGGGRYDQLVGVFLGRDIPATGTSIGLERIIDVLTESGRLDGVEKTKTVLVANFGEGSLDLSLQIANLVRKRDIACEIYFEKDPLRDQIGYANSRQIPLVIICGPKEKASAEATVKNLATGEQKSFKLEKLGEEVARLLSLE